MQIWINYWNLIFWFSLLGFIFNSTNFLNLFLYSEISWLFLYNYSIFAGLSIDDLNLISTTFFILALAGLEFAIGFLLILLFKNFNIPIIFNDTQNFSTNIFKTQSTKINNTHNFF